ncbi:collagen alpha-1(XII) chain-like [Dendroctonus ponderosae]|uniref:collagen alpha-1(XII) chain-like n=1 Tax=Dendroctonus ponderosae TaxID=77166 RepID=UPI0020363136|nr:collagen alpha-1(XII) chain-like [Dendroctonus ponderosae]
MPGGLGAPENITITFLNPTTVRVSWATTLSNVDKYDITYKPTDARVVAIVAGNSDAVTLSNLNPDTQYQLTVSAVWGGRKYRSRPIVFRTLEPPRSSPQQESMAVAAGVSATSHTTIITSTTSTTDSSTTKLSSTETYVPVDYPQTSSTVSGFSILDRWTHSALWPIIFFGKVKDSSREKRFVTAEEFSGPCPCKMDEFLKWGNIWVHALLKWHHLGTLVFAKIRLGKFRWKPEEK